jgi:uncharacterized protein DUF3300
MRPYAPVLCISARKDSSHSSSSASTRTALIRVTVVATALFLALTVQGKLHAQQMPEQTPGNGRYAPEQQSGNTNNRDSDEQPGYQAPQSDGQQAYPQQTSQGPGPTDTEPSNGQVPLSPPDLEQLVAPIALYPDALVAQVLTASTYPQQIADADHWRRAQGYAPAEEIVAGADAQPWDPSVKALTAFPQVLDQMDQNLNWTSELGNAYYNQPQDVLRAVQVMRQRAQAAGNLRSTPQESVSYDQGNIVLAPVNPQLVYVPAYNPWAVYGQPVAPYPGFSVLGTIGSFRGSAFGPSAVRFGLGIAMTAFTHTPWGWLGWGLNWLAQAVLFNHSNYYSHSTTVADWGLPHGGPRAFGRQGAFAANRSYRSFGGYGGPGAGYGGIRSQGFSRARNEDAFAANRPGERYSRSYQTSRNGYGPSSRDAYRGVQPAIARSQQTRSQQFGSRSFGNSGYASNSYGRSSYGRSSGSFGSRVNPTYGGSMRGNRMPGAGFRRSDFGKHSSGGFGGKGFSGSSGKQHSGGFHFGGGHAPKNSGGGKSFGHGHSGGGGHSGGHGHSGGKHHH